MGKKPNGTAKGPQRQAWSGICSALISEKACVAAISQYAEGNRSQELLGRENNRREEAGTGCVGLELELSLQTYVSNRDISL